MRWLRRWRRVSHGWRCGRDTGRGMETGLALDLGAGDGGDGGDPGGVGLAARRSETASAGQAGDGALAGAAAVGHRRTAGEAGAEKMIASLWGWLTGNAAGPMASALALLLAAGLIGQTVRIDGLPLVGGGFKAEIAGLQQQVAARDLADAKARADALAARQKWIAAGEAEARAHLAASAATGRQIETIVEKVPVYVGEKSNAACVVPWGAVRLLDAAAS